MIGTGNKAKLHKINNVEEVSLLYDFSESQILDILPYKDGYKCIATGNNANIYLLSDEYSNEGAYESVVYDTSYISSWGCISWNSNTPSQTELKLFTRSGNSRKPDITWSDWSREYTQSGEKIKSPSARFIQYRAILTTNNSATTPILDNVCIPYLPQNQPPLIKSIKISSPKNSSKKNADNNKTSKNLQTNPYPPSHQPDLPDYVVRAGEFILAGAVQTGNRANLKNDNSNFEFIIHEPKKLISWESKDPNDDRLMFDLEYKSCDEKKWKELKSNIKKERKYYWNTNRIPDGYYQVKVIASDILDNPIELALKEEKISNTFLVDNTRPVILELEKIAENNDTITISGITRDEMCNISEIQYSIDSGEWKPVFPKDKIFDSKEESFLLKIPNTTPEERTVVINAIDVEGNIGSSKIVFIP